jgi:hypothetical protein
MTKFSAALAKCSMLGSSSLLSGSDCWITSSSLCFVSDGVCAFSCVWSAGDEGTAKGWLEVGTQEETLTDSCVEVCDLDDVVLPAIGDFSSRECQKWNI